MGPNDMDLNESFQALEEKISRAGEVLKRAITEKRDLENTLEKLKAGSSESEKRFETLQQEVKLLRREREEVRARIEKLLKQIELVTNSGAAG
jgi:predicted  nucleic acid-binding Zn-ribbon protein